MQSGDSSKKISKIRTFQNDISSVRPNTNQAVPVEKEVIEKTSPNTQKLSEQTIFKPASSNTPPVIEPKILEEKIIEDKTPPPTPTTVPPTPTKEPNVATSPKLVPTAPKISPLAKAIPKETLASIVNTDVSQVISDDTSSEGSIITDQKRTRFSLISSLNEAVRTWLTDEKESIKERAETKRKAIPTVRPVEKRKEVLQKAAQQSAMAPKDDHRQLATKLAALPKAKVKQDDKPVQIKKKAAPVKPSWSHFTDNQKKQDIKEPSLPTTSTPEKVSEPIATVLPPAPVKQTPTEFIPAPKIPDKVEEGVVAPAIAPTPTSKPTVIASAKPPEIKLVGNKKKISFAGFGRFLTYSGIAAVIVMAVTAGVGLVWWVFSTTNQTPTVSLVEEDVSSVQQEIVAYEDSAQVTLPLKKAELWQNILGTEPGQGSDFVLLSLINSDNTPATTEEILATINWPSNSAFLRNIEEVNFGLYRGTPVMVMKAANFDAVFGGLLSSESTMSKDLDLFISSNTEPLAANFTDELIQNHDIRVLKNESGGDVLVYGFVNRTTIVIASNRETFSEMANRVR